MEWRGIPICPGYEVSDTGAVRKVGKEQVKAVLTVRGRPYVSVRRRLYQVHRLVAWAFIGPKPHEKSQVCHIDGDKWNNSPSNLYWGDSVSNGLDRRRLGEGRGERNGRCRLTPEKVIEIARTSGEISGPTWAKELGVGLATINHIRTGKNWSHLTGIVYQRKGVRKLTERQVLAVRNALRRGERVTHIARSNGCTHEAIRAIRDGRTWKEGA